jgi:serine/threonine protein kinase
MSPELVRGEKTDARSDALLPGVIPDELLTRKKPFSGETMSSLVFAIIKSTPEQPSVVDGKVHSSWDEIMRKALAKDRDDRYPTVKEFAQAVRDAPAR